MLTKYNAYMEWCIYLQLEQHSFCKSCLPATPRIQGLLEKYFKLVFFLHVWLYEFYVTIKNGTTPTVDKRYKSVHCTMYFTLERAEWKPITGNYNKYKCPNSSTRIYGLCLVKQVYQVIRFMIVKQVVCRDFCLLQKHWIHQRRWLIKGQTTKAQLFQDPGFLMTSQCPEQCDKMLWLALKRYYIKAWSRFEISFWTLMAESAFCRLEDKTGIPSFQFQVAIISKVSDFTFSGKGDLIIFSDCKASSLNKCRFRWM